jgi:hypothetical protein
VRVIVRRSGQRRDGHGATVYAHGDSLSHAHSYANLNLRSHEYGIGDRGRGFAHCGVRLAIAY